MQDVTADDFHKRYERPSEAAWKALKQNLIDNVPEEMKQQPKWVAVVTVVEDGKEHLGKRIIDCHNGSWAKSSDPNTWTDFETALAYAETHGADTIAFALTGEDNIACIDVDSCVGEDGKYSAKAIETYCKADNTYCERSISGKGLHFFGKTTMQDDLKSFSTDGKLEFYRNGHFISMTGDIETGCKEIISARTLNGASNGKGLANGKRGFPTALTVKCSKRRLRPRTATRSSGSTTAKIFITTTAAAIWHC